MPPDPVRVLLVANQTAATETLQRAVRERAARGPCAFTLLVPRQASALTRMMNPDDASDAGAQAVLDDAVPLLSQAAGSSVEGRVGVAEPLTAIQDALNLVGFDEIILSTLPHRLSRWLHLDLPHKVAGLGLPLTTVIGAAAEEPAPAG